MANKSRAENWFFGQKWSLFSYKEGYHMVKTLVQGWVYTIKDDPDNPIYKAFSIAKGYEESIWNWLL